MVVEQRHRGALLAAGVAEGVVAHDRAVGERLVEVPAVLVELAGEALDRLAQVAHPRVERLHVVDDVALVVAAEDHGLGAPQAAQRRATAARRRTASTRAAARAAAAR